VIGDLPAYLRRIGFSGAARTDMATLVQVALRHPQAIAFENLDAFTGKAVSLAPQDVERKLVQHGRGGWCFEQNLLLGNALRGLGFAVSDLAARVIWNRPQDAVVPRTHRLLQVEVDNRRWLVDAGFGGQTLTGVLDIDSDQPQPTPHEPFRLRPLGGELILESLIRGEWLPLFRFDRQPQQPVDFEAANYQLAHDPASHFTFALTVSHTRPGGRQVMRGHPQHGIELVFHPLQGESQRRVLRDADEVLQILRNDFALPVDGLPRLRERLDRLLERHGEASRGSNTPAT
jgi:N-hydroxyarylamine O-acetyltransferase